MDDLNEVMLYSKNLKLLYVEDNKDSREATKLIFDEFFLDVVIAIDGQDGYEKFQENEIDIIIADVNMPRLNGLDMIEKIRQIDKNIPILILSAYNEASYFVRSIKIGVAGYVLKPIDISQLLPTLRGVTEKIKLQQQVEAGCSLSTQYQKSLELKKEPILILAKIIDYDILNKFYGKKIIMKIEKSFSIFLFEIMKNHFFFDDVFLLGEGKFAFSQEKKSLFRDMARVEDIEQSIKEIIYKIDDENFKMDGIVYDISVQMSFSYENNVLDNALLGLKALENTKQNYICANNLASIEYEKSQQNMKTFKLVNKAIDNNQIISYFQPIIDNKTQKIVKYESLVRLVDENQEVLSPFLFLDIAKQGKFSSQITKIVLENSFKALKKTDKFVSMNLSALDIEKESISNFIFDILEKNKENSSRVIFELLEDENVKDMNSVKKFITRVKKEYGVRIAIDDFGAGYSNFEHILEYQPDILKIDESLIKNILDDDYSLAVVKTLITFAKSQKIKIIAEYVEKKEIYELLKDLDIEYSQGYYFGKPKPLEEITDEI